MALLDVNWLAVVLAALSGFVVGGIWYGPVMGRRWMGAVGLSEEDVKGANMGLIYGSAFAFSIVASFMLAHLLASVGAPGLGRTLAIALGIAIGFVVTAIGTNYLFSQKSRSLFFIDAGYWILFYLAMGLIHGLLA